ncbi:MAG: baseplate J/gp47 family protein [Actinomycetota bacterium]|nr:baseplate J/gp47 family protein [Actinomycetota bacterium]
MIYFCAQSNRRELVLQAAGLNGIDYLEVLGDPGCGTQLAVTMLKDARNLQLTPTDVSITGGAPVSAKSLSTSAADPNAITVELDRTGDFSTYTFALIAGPDATGPPAGVDPQLSHVEFSFKAGCPTPADCLPSLCCPPDLPASPDINYLAKDYNGFLQVMRDRLAVIAPGWTETHAADLGVAIAEVLAYAADHLSYQQDAVSTEAYLGTARSRISLRRHARLVDYTIGEGCNARTLVHVETDNATGLPIPAGTLFYVGAPGLPSAAKQGDPVAQRLQSGRQPAFAAMEDSVVWQEHNEIAFYTWRDSECCLTIGATAATLSGQLLELGAGDVLIFEEVLGPVTGQPEDADPAHRCAVCLTEVRTGVDPLGGAEITQIAWGAEDALTFPLCISAKPGAEVVEVSVARGNIIPADHGAWIDPSEKLGPVPPAPPAPEASAACSCETGATVTTPLPRFYPSLAQAPLTFSPPFTGVTSADSFLRPGTADAVPNLKLASDLDGAVWTATADLLSSHPTDHAFVPEIEHDGTVFLRFGDGVYGAKVDHGMTFTTTYRTGNGSAGNIGRDTLAHAVVAQTYRHPLNEIKAVRNPLAASGGIDPEGMDRIRRFAPFSYQSQLRCVTEADYAQQAQQVAGVAAARGTYRWTGSWYTAFVSVESAAAALTATLAALVGDRLDTRRMMGTDVAVETAVIVGLRIALEVCVDPEHFQGDVYRALMAVFITGDQCGGARGLLNAENFSFGQTVYASPLVAAAQAVEGVRSVTLSTFTRMDAPWIDGVAQGYLTTGRLDIPRCDNDPNHLDHGVFVLGMDGGR